LAARVLCFTASTTSSIVCHHRPLRVQHNHEWGTREMRKADTSAAL
jgi:hypothetical protein